MTEYKYVLSTSILNKEPIGVLKITQETTWFIPFDPANTDYQEYLKWVAEGNEPLPAEEQ